MLLERIVKHTQDEQAFRDLESALGKSLSCGHINFFLFFAWQLAAQQSPGPCAALQKPRVKRALRGVERAIYACDISLFQYIFRSFVYFITSRLLYVLCVYLCISM